MKSARVLIALWGTARATTWFIVCFWEVHIVNSILFSIFFFFTVIGLLRFSFTLMTNPTHLRETKQAWVTEWEGGSSMIGVAWIEHGFAAYVELQLWIWRYDGERVEREWKIYEQKGTLIAVLLTCSAPCIVCPAVRDSRSKVHPSGCLWTLIMSVDVEVFLLISTVMSFLEQIPQQQKYNGWFFTLA